jgi:S-formylglutathione hydrolase FrmB
MKSYFRWNRPVGPVGAAARGASVAVLRLVEAAQLGRRRARAAGLVASLCLAAVLGLPGSASAAPYTFQNSDGITFQSGDGLTLTSANQTNPITGQQDPRLTNLTFTTSALPDPVSVDVLMPSDYNAGQTYPVLYLLDGTEGAASNWVQYGEAEQATAGLPLIVVMPDITLASSPPASYPYAPNGNGGGWCANWPNGQQNWETFHIDQLLPWVDANLPTIPTRGERAIAGLSQGGFCSLEYAALHPDLFGTALGYSGAPDIWRDADARFGAEGIVGFIEVADDGDPPGTFFGNPMTDGINWAAHDPATLVQNLADTRTYMYWGNGFPGPYDSGAPGEPNGIEGAINYDNMDFENDVNAAGIPSCSGGGTPSGQSAPTAPTPGCDAYFEAYGDGTHSWPYWTRDLQWSLPYIMSDFANPLPAPSQINYTSGENSYSVYGWSVNFTVGSQARPYQELSTLANADQNGFQLTGSGAAQVVTPAVYTPGDSYQVSMTGPHAANPAVLTADSNGQLTMEVPLGPSSPFPEYFANAPSQATLSYTTTVTISPAS